MNEKNIVIIGGTSTIALHCAEQWLMQTNVHVTLVVRNPIKADKAIEGLKALNPHASIDMVVLDFHNPIAIEEWVTSLSLEKTIDIVLIAQGYLPKQSASQNNLATCNEVLLTNGVSPVLFAEAFAKPMQAANHGTIALISSIAGDKAMKNIYTYGAGKAMIDHYARGLQERFKGSRVAICLIKPGPVATPLIADMHFKGVAKPSAVLPVANYIVKQVEKGKPLIYVPRRWRYIMAIFRWLPL